jgi:hypothetical protein
VTKITDPQLRAGILNVAKRYRDLAKQVVAMTKRPLERDR